MKYQIQVKEKGRGGDQYTIGHLHTNIHHVAAHIDALITEDLEKGFEPSWYSVEIIEPVAESV